MTRRYLLPLPMLLCLPLLAQTDRHWTLVESTLTYHMSHPIHEVDGVSHAAKGKGNCHERQCDFLVAVPVKTFDSGDSNRDLHMIQVTRGAQFPVVMVRFRLPEDKLSSPTIQCDLDIEFAGQKAHYSNLTFQQEIHGETHHVTGVIPSTLTDFKISPPTFFTVPIRNAIPVKLDLTWQPS